MNVLNLEVKIKKIKIKTNDNSSICFSLRLGRILSGLSNTIVNSHTNMNKNNSEIDTNVQLSIGCQQSILTSNNRASLVIYQARSQQSKDIIGMVFILLKNQQGQLQRYKIQQSNDPNSYVELVFNISAIQVKQKQNESLASKSSLAQIKQLHRALTRGHKKTTSDVSYQQSQIKKSRLSPNQKQKQQKLKFNLKIPHLKSQQSAPFDHDQDQPTLKISLKNLQQQLSKQRQRNSILINLLVVEEEKNTQSENYIKNFISCLEKIQNKKNQPLKVNTQNIQLKQNHQNLKINSKQQSPKTQNKKQTRKQSQSLNLQMITKQRDELYIISQQLYEKTRSYKNENQQLFRNLKATQNDLKLVADKLQQTRSQNIQLKKQIFQLNDKKDNEGSDLLVKINEIGQQNKRLKKQNVQYQRKFKQSFRAIQEFKNDAWKAQQQIILKDQQIANLKQDMKQIKIGIENIRQYKSTKQFSQIQSPKLQNYVLLQTQSAFKQMSALLIKNNLQRKNLLDKIYSKQQQIKQPHKSQIYKILSGMKQKISELYKQYQKQNKKSITILQMRRKLLQIINSSSF